MVHIEKRKNVWKVIIGGRASPKNFYKLKTAKKYRAKIWKQMGV
jgi:hypothetical protein